ncbi:hypothetical protein RJ640_013906 [Escallonia rubra]|uniref:Uncharacterized protein n=1 Tax=Escallonia rubra TaxID=112253 RepID=A0AA88UUR5_9ASTE|nr:hypothetical protein RJ640_013906 [Escallonia rubra]
MCLGRTAGDYDITFEVLYCGICHSDLDMVKNEWGITQYPVLPGLQWAQWMVVSAVDPILIASLLYLIKLQAHRI